MMDITQAEKVLSRFRDFVATKPPSVKGTEMFDAIQVVLHNRERLDLVVAKLPKCWRLVDGELREDCPVVPGMVMYFLFGPSYRIELYERTVKTIEADGWMTWVEKGPERGRMSEDCFNSQEAAEFVPEQAVKGTG